MEPDLILLDPVEPFSLFDYYLLDLGCIEVSERTDGKSRWLSIYIIELGDEFIRVLPDKIASHGSRVKWAKESRERKTILVRKRLLPREHTRMKTFLGSRVVVLSRGSFPPQIKRPRMAGYPFSFFKNIGKIEEMSGPISFTFRNASYESLTGIVNLELGIGLDDEVVGNSADQNGMMHCVIICGLEWKEEHLEPWAAIYADHDSLTEDVEELTNEILDHSLASDDVLLDNRSLEAIHDIMLREYSDVSGNMVQDMMPQSVMLGSRWKLTLINETAANIEQTKRSDVDWKEVKEYEKVVWLECHEVTEQKKPGGASV
jgi:hypothetical protein